MRVEATEEKAILLNNTMLQLKKDSHGRKRKYPSTKGDENLNSKNHKSAKQNTWNKGLWSKEEDARLCAHASKQILGQYRKINWTYVSNGVKTRSCKQCRERWINHLDPAVKKTKWTEKEDSMLLELGKKHPNKWARIAKHIPGRPENMVKIRWQTLQKDIRGRAKYNPKHDATMPLRIDHDSLKNPPAAYSTELDTYISNTSRRQSHCIDFPESFWQTNSQNLPLPFYDRPHETKTCSQDVVIEGCSDWDDIFLKWCETSAEW